MSLKRCPDCGEMLFAHRMVGREDELECANDSCGWHCPLSEYEEPA